MASRELRVLFKGDSSDLNRAADSADKSLTGVGKSGKGFMGAMSAMAGPAAAAAAGVGAVVAVGMDFAKAAAEDEQSAKSLANVLRQTAGATDAQVAGAEQWIAATSKSVAVADDDLRPALQRLAGATHDTGAAQGLLSQALDISAGTGKPLEAVVEALTKAQLGQTTGLGRLGLATKDAAGNNMDLNQILEQSKTQFGGLAEAATHTASGGMEKAKIAMGEMKENIGSALLPVLGALASFFTDTVLPAVDRLVGYIRDHWPQIMATIKPIMESVQAVISGVVDLVVAIFKGPFGQYLIMTVTNTFQTIVNVIGPLLRIVKGIIDVFAGLLTGDWSRLWNGIKGIVSGIWDGIVAILSGLWDRVKGTFSALTDLITAPFKAAFNAIARLWNDTVGKLSFHIPGWVPGIGGEGFDVPDIPTFGGRMAPMGGVVVNMPTGTDPYATVAALNVYTARVGPIDLAATAIR